MRSPELLSIPEGTRVPSLPTVRRFMTRLKGTAPGARFSKVPRTFRARKAIRKITTCLFCKADLFTCCKGNKNKNNDKVSCLETPSFWRYKENYVTRNTPKKFRDFREPGPWSGRISPLAGYREISHAILLHFSLSFLALHSSQFLFYGSLTTHHQLPKNPRCHSVLSYDRFPHEH